MNILEWFNIQEKKEAPCYAHFDFRVSVNQCKAYITNPSKVSVHGFYPFIHYNMKSRKIKDGKKAKPKVRSIYYAAHLDGMIYKYYAYLLNEQYNERIEKDGTSSVSVAYRTNLGKNNIHFSREAFDFVRSSSPCYVMIGDFTDFFDTLDHSYLKQQLCDLLKVNLLSADYYAIFKNITKFSFMELSDILQLNSLQDNLKGRRQLNKKTRVLSPKEFRANTKFIAPNTNNFGIPQGSPISAALANIYMLTIDKTINDYVKENNGFYMRYSDDFMIVLPHIDRIEFSEQYKWIKEKLQSVPNLTLQEKKTKIFHVNGNYIENCTEIFVPTAAKGKNIIDFLGFSFDGKIITVRDNTISKYYHRMYRKIKTITHNHGYTPDGKHISCKKLYEKYSYKGSISYQNRVGLKCNIYNNREKIMKGNFLDYIERAQKVYVNEPLNQSTKNHMQKIRKQLKK